MRRKIGTTGLLVAHLAMVALLLSQFVIGKGDWFTALALILNALCAWYRVVQLDWFFRVGCTRAEAKPDPIDPKLFMPYSTCPKCNTEALHWLASDQAAWDFGIHRGIKQYRDKHDLFRECRECGHIWSQKVGAA